VAGDSDSSQGLSIGEVLVRLRDGFPDITISKIRFLEAEGLVEPARTPAGYRRFTDADVDRLRYVLTAQRDRYLPLRVIKEQLDAMDSGQELTRQQLLDESGLSDDVLSQLETSGLIERYDSDALTIARTAARMAAYGVEVRHLRLFRTAADREVGLAEQVAGPRAGELAALSVQLHAALVRASLTRRLPGWCAAGAE
jgi:DNA-binding transcriptional MerR regulator